MRLALLGLASLLGCTTASGQSRADQAPLVIELFTSQGCSSCPPADRLLGRLAHDGSVGGRPVAPLAFHVDYWDDLGWPDPFALPAWTERQRSYAHALGDDRVYTPELVVGGRAGMVGSNVPRVLRAIADVLPLTYFLRLVRNVMLHGHEIWSQGTNVAVVAAWGILGVIIALRAFRWEPHEG